MKHAWHPEAKVEAAETIEYYNAQRSGLGDEFLDEVTGAIQRIGMSPETWPRVHEDCRRCPTRRFPFGVIYRILEDGILVLAIAHGARRPGYWIERID